MFLDIDLLLELVQGYDLITHEIRDLDGNFLLKVDVESIREDFKLYSVDEVTDMIDFKMFDEAFDQAGVDRQ